MPWNRNTKKYLVQSYPKDRKRLTRYLISCILSIPNSHAQQSRKAEPMPALAIDPRNWSLDRSVESIPDQNPSARSARTESVSRETLFEVPIVRTRTISGLLGPSPNPFVLANTRRFRRCSCSAGFADTCPRRSDRQTPPTFGCHPVDWAVPERFFVTHAAERINPMIRSWINAMMPTRPIDKNLIRFINWATRPIVRLVKATVIRKATSTPPPAIRKATRDSILSEIEWTLDWD